MQYSASRRWRHEDIGPATAVLDFPFHPQALVWVDHHDTTFANPVELAHFQQSDLHVFDTNALSCPALIATLPWFGMTPHWNDYVDWANIIDGARYPSAQCASNLENPHILLAHVISELNDDASVADVVRRIPSSDANGVLRGPTVLATRERVLRDNRRIRRELRSRLRVDDAVAVLDQSDTPIPYRRYLAYEAYPAVRYGIGLYQSGAGIIVSVGENPWEPGGPVHLGELCREYGGGGRRSTAGIPALSRGAAYELASAIASRLNAELRNLRREAAAG